MSEQELPVIQPGDEIPETMLDEIKNGKGDDEDEQ